MCDIILNLEKQSPSQSFHHHAFWLGMLLGVRPDAMSWVYENYINASWRDADYYYEPYYYSGWAYQDRHIFEYKSVLFEKKFLNLCQFDVENIIKRLLSDGYYACGIYNERYVPESLFYPDHDLDHNFLVYGYDDAKRIFYSIGIPGITFIILLKLNMTY